MYSVLIVDDEEQILQMIQQILEKLGYRVTPCHLATEALAYFRQEPLKYDLVITDMYMPQMTGLELLDQLLLCRSDTPVLLCTGFSELMDEKQAKAKGIRDYILKPIYRQELAEKIRQILDNEAALVQGVAL